MRNKHAEIEEFGVTPWTGSLRAVLNVSSPRKENFDAKYRRVLAMSLCKILSDANNSWKNNSWKD